MFFIFIEYVILSSCRGIVAQRDCFKCILLVANIL